MEKIKKIVWFLIAYALIISVIHYFRIGGEQYDNIATVINIITLLITIYFGYSAVKYFGLKTMQGKSVLCIMISMVSWLIGDMIWLVNENAIVSIADAFWLVAYPILGLAILYGIKTFSPDFFSQKKKLIVLGLILAVLVIIYFKFFPLSWDSEISIIENIVISGYIIVDLLLLMLIILLVLLVFSGFYSQAWIVIAIGITCTLTGDLYYAVNYESYSGGDLIDLAWYFGYLLYGLGFALMEWNAKKALRIMKRKMPKTSRKG